MNVTRRKIPCGQAQSVVQICVTKKINCHGVFQEVFCFLDKQLFPRSNDSNTTRKELLKADEQLLSCVWSFSRKGPQHLEIRIQTKCNLQIPFCEALANPSCHRILLSQHVPNGRIKINHALCHC